MIQLIRIDDRLLHGQVAYSWKAQLQYNAVVIISESASKDELRKATLKMCAPSGVKLATRGVIEGAKLLNNPKLKDMKVFVVVEDVNTLQRLLPLLEEKVTINLGGQMKKEGRKEFSPAVFLSDLEVEQLDQIVRNGYEVIIQQVPANKGQVYKPARED